MNEFIIWDDGILTFAEAMEDKTPSGGFVPFDYIIKCDGYLKGALYGKYPSFKYIGLKDINNKKIYADSSIIEFTYIDLKTKENVKLQGYFTWNDEDLRYEIDVLNHSLYICLNYRVNLVVVIKIIDTIQENKLGLIK